MSSSLRKALNELPSSLDGTYERALEGIPKERRQHAHRLFQCLVAAIRPLDVEELAEIFAIKFDPEAEPNLLEGWRPENPEEAVLSACSTLIAIVDNEGSKIVQFSHFSVKEFLTSGRLRMSEVGSIRQYHIPLHAAHAVLARACLTVLLQLDEKVDKRRLATFPLAFYAAEHWVDHVKFEDVASRFQDIMECLFNPKKPCLAAWTWIYDVWHQSRKAIDTLTEHPPPPKETALFCAALCGFSSLANYLIVTHGEDVNAGYDGLRTPLQVALHEGHLDVARLLLDHGANANLGETYDTPLVTAYRRNNLEVMRLLLEYGADANVEYDPCGLISHDASFVGQPEVLELLLRYKAEVNARTDSDRTPLHWASVGGRVKVMRLLLEHGADINARSVKNDTPLCLASQYGHLDAVRVLLEHGANIHVQGDEGLTAFQQATSRNQSEVAGLLLEHGAEKA
jgi:Ankyrin repeats (3 copies)/Ankyrin repeats (many copies)